MKIKRGIQRDIRAISRIRRNFEKRGFNTTARWLNYLQDNIKEDNPSDYVQDYADISDAFEKDIKKHGDYPWRIYKEIKQVFGSVLLLGPKKRKELRILLTDVDPFFQEWHNTQENLLNIANIVDNDNISSEPIAKFYLMCFSYIIAIEGSYENWMKILYYLYYNVISNPVTLEKVEKLNLRDVKNWMISRGIDEVMFEGYKDGHLRNAIAHANFHYNKSSNKMIFINRYKNVEKYREELSLIKFQDVLQKVLIIPDICSLLIMILRIHDIIMKYTK